MTRALRFGIAGLLLLVTAVLLGYTAYTVRERTTSLENQVAFLSDERSAVRIYAQERRLRLFAVILEPPFQTRLQAVVKMDDTENRQLMIEAVFQDLFGRAGPFSVSGIYGVYDSGFTWWLDRLVDAETVEDRARILEELNQVARGEGAIEAPVIVEEDYSLIGNLSAIVTALGGLGSGILSFLIFFKGGGVRKLDEEMLALDVELKRIEVAKARFAARELLGASELQ